MLRLGDLLGDLSPHHTEGQIETQRGEATVPDHPVDASLCVGCYGGHRHIRGGPAFRACHSTGQVRHALWHHLCMYIRNFYAHCLPLQPPPKKRLVENPNSELVQIPSAKGISNPVAATVLLMDLIRWPWGGSGQPNQSP